MKKEHVMRQLRSKLGEYDTNNEILELIANFYIQFHEQYIKHIAASKIQKQWFSHISKCIWCKTCNTPPVFIPCKYEPEDMTSKPFPSTININLCRKCNFKNKIVSVRQQHFDDDHSNYIWGEGGISTSSQVYEIVKELIYKRQIYHVHILQDVHDNDNRIIQTCYFLTDYCDPQRFKPGKFVRVDGILCMLRSEQWGTNYNV